MSLKTDLLIRLGCDLEPSAGAIPDIRIIPLGIAAIMPVIARGRGGLGWHPLLLLNVYRRRRWRHNRRIAVTVARPKTNPWRKSVTRWIAIVGDVRRAAIVTQAITTQKPEPKHESRVRMAPRRCRGDRNRPEQNESNGNSSRFIHRNHVPAFSGGKAATGQLTASIGSRQNRLQRYSSHLIIAHLLGIACSSGHPLHLRGSCGFRFCLHKIP